MIMKNGDEKITSILKKTQSEAQSIQHIPNRVNKKVIGYLVLEILKINRKFPMGYHSFNDEFILSLLEF